MARIARGYSTYTCVLGILLICFGSGASIAAWILGSKASDVGYTYSYLTTRSSTTTSFSEYWWGGIGFLIPGVLAITASCTRNVCVMTCFLVFNILCFISAAIASVLVVTMLIFWTMLYNLYQSSQCLPSSTYFGCVCTSYYESYSITASCEVIDSVQVNLGALFGMLVVTLFISFIALYVTCCALCHQEHDAAVIFTQPGSAYQPPFTVITNTTTNAPGFPGYPINPHPGYPVHAQSEYSMNAQPGYPGDGQSGFPMNVQPGHPVMPLPGYSQIHPLPGYPMTPLSGYPVNLPLEPPPYSSEVRVDDEARLLKNQVM